jgi:hypothetical protein
MNREHEIEDAVMRQPEILGFPRAMAIRNVRVAWHFGRVDIMLFPRRGRTKVVLVEVKHSTAPEAICKVVGQLLMYYAGALTIGETGLDLFRRYAREHPDEARSLKMISPKALTGGLTPPTTAWERIGSGKKLRPEEIALFVALNAQPHPALRLAIRRLRAHHGLPIGICVATRGGCALVEPARGPTSRRALQYA